MQSKEEQTLVHTDWPSTQDGRFWLFEDTGIISSSTSYIFVSKCLCVDFLRKRGKEIEEGRRFNVFFFFFFLLYVYVCIQENAYVRVVKCTGIYVCFFCHVYERVWFAWVNKKWQGKRERGKEGMMERKKEKWDVETSEYMCAFVRFFLCLFFLFVWNGNLRTVRCELSGRPWYFVRVDYLSFFLSQIYQMPTHPTIIWRR